jgi:hypothetical protein
MNAGQLLERIATTLKRNIGPGALRVIIQDRWDRAQGARRGRVNDSKPLTFRLPLRVS